MKKFKLVTRYDSALVNTKELRSEIIECVDYEIKKKSFIVTELDIEVVQRINSSYNIGDEIYCNDEIYFYYYINNIQHEEFSYNGYFELYEIDINNEETFIAKSLCNNCGKFYC